MRYLAGKRLTARKESLREPFCRILAHDGVDTMISNQTKRDSLIKTKLKIYLLILALLSLPGFAHAQATAQSYNIDSFTIDGGGGASSGGDFALNGTIGQSDAGAMSGGNYSLAGGFWGAIQTPPPVPTVIEVWVVNGEVHLRFNGIPGQVYEIERASFVTGPWHPNGQPFAVISMPIGGIVEFVDTTAFSASQSFYRTSTR